MNKNKIFAVFCFAFFLPLFAFSTEIERYCFQEPNGSFYDIRGGKLGKKAYTVQVTNVFCPATPMVGIVTFAKLDNAYAVTGLFSRAAGSSCTSYMWSALVDLNLQNISGNYDNMPRTLFGDGAFTTTRVACPGPLTPVEVGQPGSGPAAGKKEE